MSLWGPLRALWGQSSLIHILYFVLRSRLPIMRHGKTDPLSVSGWMLSRDGAR